MVAAHRVSYRAPAAVEAALLSRLRPGVSEGARKREQEDKNGRANVSPATFLARRNGGGKSVDIGLDARVFHPFEELQRLLRLSALLACCHNSAAMHSTKLREPCIRPCSFSFVNIQCHL